MFQINKLKIVIIVSVIIVGFLFFIYFFFFSFHSVKSFGPFKLGDQAPVVSENVPEYAFLYTLKYKFYIYAMEKNMGYCALNDCGMSGTFVDCTGGWLSADGIRGDAGATDYGLKEEDVENGKSSMIIIADENKKIVGIYPNYTIQNVPYILKNHRNLSDKFDFCYDTQMPKRW